MRKRANIDRNKLWEKIGYTPHGPEQYQFHDSDARFRTAVCGRRFGKSTMAAIDLVEACFIPNAWYWICGPTYKLGEKEFRPVYDAFCNPKKLNMAKDIKKSYSVNQGNMRMQFPWGTTLEVVSATNKDSLQGEGLWGVIMSESAEHEMRTWQQYIQPALTDNLGWATFPSTPKGYNWFHGMFALGQHPEHPNYDSWQYPTWKNVLRYPGGFDMQCDHYNCTCNEELVEVQKLASDAFFKQEYAAQFTSFEGQIYAEFDVQIHVTDVVYNPLYRNYWVFDFGFNDPFVCLDVMVDPSDNVYIWREYQVRHKTTWEHAHIIKERENPPGFHVNAMFGDPSGPDEAATIALVLGWMSQRSREVEWNSGIEAVKRALKIQPDGKPKLFIDRSCVDLIRQMQALRAPTERPGRNAKEGQHDYDDHGPDALRYFFVEYFILGAGASLADVYDTDLRGSESESFFTTETQVTLERNVGY
jgi:hypothetical protein